MPMLVGLGLVAFGLIGLAGRASAVAKPPVSGLFHIGGQDINFPMFSDLILDFVSLTDEAGVFTGSVTMTHGNAVGNNVSLTLDSLTQSRNGFTITSVMPSGGVAAGTPGAPPTFPANSTITVNYLLATPFPPPNDMMKGTHTLQANNITCWPPLEVYTGTSPTSILRVSDNAVVGTLTAPYHSRTPPIPLFSSSYLILFGVLIAGAGFLALRRSAS